MTPYNTVQLGTHIAEIMGQCVTFDLVANIYYDEYHILDNGDKLMIAKNHRLIPSGIEVVATAKDCESGSDSLWNVLLKDNEEVLAIVKDHDMVEKAINFAIGNTLRRARQLSRFIQ